MIVRLLVVVEGQTEEGFVNRVLAPHLANFNVFAEARLITTKYRQGQVRGKGGGRHYRNWRDDLRRLRKQDQNPDRWLTTMVDLYGLARLEDGFPGYSDYAGVVDPRQRVAAIEKAFEQDLGVRQFIPYVQLHEYEALLLADPQKLDVEYLDNEAEICRLVELSAGFETPELIDEGEDTAPSKRIIRELPDYRFNKPRVGTLVAEKIGLATLRTKCPHFDEWVSRLESIGPKD